MVRNWVTKKIKDIATFSQGIQIGIEKQEKFPKPGFIRFLRIVDYTQDNQEYRYVSNPGDKYYVNDEDIVMVRYGTPGLIGRGKCGIIANNLFKISIIEENICKNYLSLYLSQSKIQTYLSSQGSSTMPAITFKHLSTVDINYPTSLQEQKQIVEKLDQAFEFIDQAKANIEQNIINAKELFQSKLHEVFSQKGDGWKEYKLKDTGKIVSGATPKSKVSEYWDGDISWITPKDLGTLGEQKYILETSRKITELGLSRCSAQLMPKGSIIMSSRAPIGHLGIATDNICTNQGCKSIVPNENMKSEYIYYFLLSSKEALNKLGTGAVFPELSGKMFGDFFIPVPILEEQEKAVKILDEASELTNSLISIYHQKLYNLEELRKSILEKAFRGEITN